MAIRSKGTEWLWAPLVIAVAVAMAVWDAVRDYREAIDHANSRLSALTRVVEARTSQTFHAVDQLLRNTAAELGPADIPGDPRVHRFMVANACINADTLNLTVVTPDGIIRHSTAGQLVGQSVGTRSYLAHFQAHPEDDSLFIGEPVEALLGRKVVFAARAVQRPDGSLRAVVVSSLPPEIFARLMEAATPAEESGTISLSNRDHIILAHTPASGGARTGESLAEAPLMKEHLAGGGRESLLESVSASDGLPRLSALRTISPYGITVAVSIAKSDLLTPMLRGMAGSATFLAGVVLVTLALLRHSRAREHARIGAEQRVIRARDHYVRILDDFPVLIRRTDLGGQCDYVSCPG